jgi:hypothetical protein
MDSHVAQIMEATMKFVVTFKGVRWYCGKLAFACQYVETKWGSLKAAYEMGVKLDPVVDGGR